MKTTGLVFDQERTFVEPDKLYDRSRYKHTVTDTDITYTRLPSGLYVPTFNGTTSNIAVPANNVFSSPTGSLGFWFYTELSSARQVAGYCSDGVYERLQSLYSAATQSMQVVCQRLGEGYPYRWQAHGIDDTFPLGRWNYFVVTQDGTAPKVYANGEDTETATSSTDLTAWTSSFTVVRPLTIGRVVSSYFSGNICLVTSYNYALTASQIFAIFQAERHLFGC